MLALILFKLSAREIVADLPHDATALTVYALLLLFVGFIWAGSRRRPS